MNSFKFNLYAFFLPFFWFVLEYYPSSLAFFRLYELNINYPRIIKFIILGPVRKSCGHKIGLNGLSSIKLV